MKSMIRSLSMIAVITVISVSSVNSEDVCSVCQCTTKYFPSPISIYFTDITCNATTTKKIDFNTLEIKDASHVRDLIISGYEDVILSTEFISTNNSTRPSQTRNVQVTNVSHLHISNWCNYCNYSFINIHRISLKQDLDGSGIEIDSLLIKNSFIPFVNSKNMNFKMVYEKVIFTHVELDQIKSGAIRFYIWQQLIDKPSTFLMAHSKVGKKNEPGSIEVQADNIIITKSQFVGSTSNFKLVGNKKIILTKNNVIQSKQWEFFDLYSPSIVLSKNSLSTYIDDIKTTKYYG